MKNWKTSLSGLVAAILQACKTIVPPEFSVIFDAASGLALALLGYFAADKK